MIYGSPGSSPRTIEQDLTFFIVTGYMVLASVVNGAMMALRSDVFTAHPRYTGLDQLLHGNLEAFGIVLAAAGVINGAASVFGEDITHLFALKVRIAATFVCGLCWSTNAYTQARNVGRTGDWPGLTGVGLLAGLFVLLTAARWVYYRRVRADDR